MSVYGSLSNRLVIILNWLPRITSRTNRKATSCIVKQAKLFRKSLEKYFITLEWHPREDMYHALIQCNRKLETVEKVHGNCVFDSVKHMLWVIKNWQFNMEAILPLRNFRYLEKILFGYVQWDIQRIYSRPSNGTSFPNTDYVTLTQTRVKLWGPVTLFS